MSAAVWVGAGLAGLAAAGLVLHAVRARAALKAGQAPATLVAIHFALLGLAGLGLGIMAVGLILG